MDRAGDLAREALAAMMPPARRAEFEVCTAWPDAAGPEVASRTSPVRVRGGTLVVATPNAAWANELGYVSEDLKEKLNAALGAELVKRIKFVVKPDPAPEEESP